MKHLIISAFVISGFIISIQAFGQTTLENRFGEEAIQSIQGTEKLAILEFQNENGYVVQDLSGIKDVSGYPDALEVAPINEDTPLLTEAFIDDGFELFAYNFSSSGKTNKYYRVGDTGKLLIIYSIKVVKKKFAQNNSMSK